MGTILSILGVSGITLTWPERLLMFFSPFLIPLATASIQNFNLDVLVRVLIMIALSVVLLKIRCKDNVDLTSMKTYLSRTAPYLLAIWYIVLMVLSFLYYRSPYIPIIYNLLTSPLGSIVLGFMLVASYRTDAVLTCK